MEVFRPNSVKTLKAALIDHSEELTILAYFLLKDSQKANEMVVNVLYRLWGDGKLDESKPEGLFAFLSNEIRQACVLDELEK